MRGVEPPSRAWEARVIAVIRHPQDLDRIAPISRLSQDEKFFYSWKEEYALHITSVLDLVAISRCRTYCNRILQG